MSATAIEWTDATWNPVTGCSKVSPGCAHCYAEAVTARYAGGPGWIEEHRPWTPANAEHNVRLRPERLDQPLRWRRPRMVFVNSMSDLFHELVPDDYIAHVWTTMARAERHTFQVLTKRPERMAALVPRLAIRNGQPLPNVWLGVSIENRRFVDRADLLRQSPAAVRFVSAEPLLGALASTLDLTGIDWLIVGGESGPNHRPMRVEWVRDLRDACLAQGLGHLRPDPGGRTAFFFKQHGGRTPKAGGRELDGRTWDELPAVPS